MINFSVYRLTFRKRTVFIGISNDLNNTRMEHIKGSKLFSKMESIYKADTLGEAKKLKATLLQEYRNRNFGRNPKYNQEKIKEITEV